jgi:hypothetical protein
MPKTQTYLKIDRLDVLALTAIFSLIVFYAIRSYDFSRPPAEDSAMLMRYAEHLANGYGVVWNPGEPPVDGATDFLFMVALAGLVKLGVSVEMAVRGLGFASHFLTVAVVYGAIRQLYGTSRWPAIISAAYLGLGSGLSYIAACFGTPFFALFGCLAWYWALRYIKDPSFHRAGFWFSFCALLAGLTRPEGVFLGLFMLAAILYGCGRKQARSALIYFLSFFAIVGGMYFFWRWKYFGFPLPNPFYKKSAEHFYPVSLIESVKNSLLLLGPFSLMFMAALRRSDLVRRMVFTLIPVIGFASLWFLVSNEMNYCMRFQYVILPIVLISWPMFLDGVRSDWGLPEIGHLSLRNRQVLILSAISIALAILFYQTKIGKRGAFSFPDGRYDLAVQLKKYADRNYTLATTEAGLLPLYSTWRSIDLWGLNDLNIAHRGLSESYLDRVKPELIVIHSHTAPSPDGVNFDRWQSMVEVLTCYIQRQNYQPIAIFGQSPDNTIRLYLKPGLPEVVSLVKEIQKMRFYWPDSGTPAYNFLDTSLPMMQSKPKH